ncbi:MAG: NADH-quinone oxidoreductase subunit NuoE [Salinivirgaceae bacterium]|jgi:NADH-quinone oxidoreductase subunit E|nr:NADH-quinone oxidoreductase subunit NuoE [Salinivirgaceae bacterium]
MRVKRVEPNTKQPQTASKVDLSLMDPLITTLRKKRGNLIPILQGVQRIYGYLPEASFYKIADETGLKLADLYGVATFYAQFRLKPVGKNIVKVCHGTACHVQNAGKISRSMEDTLGIKDGETTEDMLFTLESVACLGCCSLAPVMMIGDETYGNLDQKSAAKIVKEIRRNEK